MQNNSNSKTVRTPEEAHKAEMEFILYGEVMEVVTIENQEQLASYFDAAEAGEEIDLTEFLIK